MTYRLDMAHPEATPFIEKAMKFGNRWARQQLATMKRINLAFRLFLFVIGVLTYCGCTISQPCNCDRSHALLGAWEADDDTVFIFRNDGTFRGVDFRKNEIWGNWVELSSTRIGFQSLLHDTYYMPQYAVIASDKNQMNYIVTGGNRFIHARRISIDEACSLLDSALGAKIILPNSKNTE